MLGRNTTASGTTKGVEGRVDSTDGYGLATPDDAKVGGTAELTALGGNLTGNTTVTDLVGPGLTVSNGSLDASGSKPSVSDDGVQVLSSPDDVNFASNLSVADDGDNTVTASLTSDSIDIGTGNKLSGGGNTSLGGLTTIDVQPTGVEVYIDGQTYGDADAGTWVDVLFNQIVADDGNGFDLEENEYIVPESGDYDIDLNLNWANLNGGLLEARIQSDITGDPPLMYTYTGVSNSDESIEMSKVCKELPDGGRLWAQVRYNGTGTIVGGARHLSTMSINKIS